MTSNEHIVIALHHKNQWSLRWNDYRKHIVDINITLIQKSHLIKKTVKMRDNLQKIESTLTIHIRTKRIDLKVYLHSRNVSSMNIFQCNCDWNHQMTKHVFMHCSNWTNLRSLMHWNVDFTNYRVIASIVKSLKTTMRMMMKTKLLKQFKVTRSLIL